MNIKQYIIQNFIFTSGIFIVPVLNLYKGEITNWNIFITMYIGFNLFLIFVFIMMNIIMNRINNS